MVRFRCEAFFNHLTDSSPPCPSILLSSPAAVP